MAAISVGRACVAGIVALFCAATEAAPSTVPACTSIPQSAAYPAPVEKVAARPTLQKNTGFSRRFTTRLSGALRSQPVDFAGHYVITTFGCGSGCLYGGIVDVKTGQAHELPWALYIAGQLGDWESALKHEAGSRLLAVRGAINETDEPAQERYFEWTGTALKPICTRRLELDTRTGMVR